MDADSMVMRVRVSGRVQGVSFRVWTRDRARRLGLNGWVRNEDDGSVMALIAGDETAVSSMLKDFWNGPPGASVDAVDVETAWPETVPDGFEITV